MSEIAFVQSTIKECVAPIGSAQLVSERIRLAARKLGWSYDRVKSVWYGDERVAIRPQELFKINEFSQKQGVNTAALKTKEAKDEITKLRDRIARVESALALSGEGILSEKVGAVRKPLGVNRVVANTRHGRPHERSFLD